MSKKEQYCSFRIESYLSIMLRRRPVKEMNALMIHKRDLLFLFASVLVMFSLITARSALAFDDLAASQKWNVENGWIIAWNDATNSCFATAKYKDGTTLWIGIRPDTKKGFFAIANENWTFTRKPGKYPIAFRFDRGNLWSGQMSTRSHEGSQILYVGGIKSNFIEKFAKSAHLRIELKGKILAQLSLRGTRSAVNNSVTCTEDKRATAAASSDRATDSPDMEPTANTPERTDLGKSNSRPYLQFSDEDMVSHYQKIKVPDLEKYRTNQSTQDRQDDIAITGVRITSAEHDAKNTAILVANSEYDTIGSLPGPLVDIELVAKALRYRNFDVHVFKNIKRDDVSDIVSVADKANKKGMLLVYYAGHGAIVDGKNSLILENFDPTNPSPHEQVISIDGLLEQFKNKGFASYMFAFDACRSFVGLGSSDNSAGTSGGNRNFRNISIADVKQSDLSGIDYAVSFSASEGQVALDAAEGGASPYAESFARNIREKNTIIEATLAIRNDVVTITKGAQDPGLLLKWRNDVPLSSDKTVTVHYSFGPSYGGFTQHLRFPKNALQKLSLIKNDDDINHNIEVDLPTYDFDINQEDLKRLSKSAPEEYGICSALSLTHFDWDRMCIEEYLNKKLSEGKLVTREFPGVHITAEQRLRDGVVKRDSYFELTADLNNDGDKENLIADTYRSGGIIYISNVKSSSQRTLGISSFLTPSFDSVLLRDFNKDGVSDIIIQQAAAFVILDGNQILHYLENPSVETGNTVEKIEAVLKQYFKSDGYVLGDLAPITIFFDNGKFSYDDRTDSLGYRIYTDETWNASPSESGLYDRTVYYDAKQSEVVITLSEGEARIKPVWQLQ